MVWVYLNNIDAIDMVKFGCLQPKPGDEQNWYEKLPPKAKEYLESHRE